MNYVGWALLGMAAYSVTTLMVKLATRTGQFNVFAVLAMATTMVAVTAMLNALIGGHFADKTVADFGRSGALFSYATGVSLTIAVLSLFKGLSLGPASVVVPIYGMFIVAGAVLSIVFLHEPITARKALGLLMAITGVYFVAS